MLINRFAIFRDNFIWFRFTFAYANQVLKNFLNPTNNNYTPFKRICVFKMLFQYRLARIVYFFHDYWINIRIYSKTITREKVIFLLMRLITPAVLRVRVSSIDWLQQPQVFIMWSLKFVFPRIKKTFFLNIPKIKMKRENLVFIQIFRSPRRDTCDRYTLNVGLYSKFVLTKTDSFSNILIYKNRKQNCMLFSHSYCLTINWKTLEQMLNRPFATCCLSQWRHLLVMLWRV